MLLDDHISLATPLENNALCVYVCGHNLLASYIASQHRINCAKFDFDWLCDCDGQGAARNWGNKIF